MMKRASFWGSCFVLGLILNPVNAQCEDQYNQPAIPAAASVQSAPAGTAPVLSGAVTASAGGSIPPGTMITTQNWQQYKQFMPEGMIGLFDGSYQWKMPSDVQMEVGPTDVYPLPKTYLEATEKYSGQVKIVDLPDGALTLSNYQGGMPFPNLAEPHIGWKILANLWYRYLPHLIRPPALLATTLAASKHRCKWSVGVTRILEGAFHIHLNVFPSALTTLYKPSGRTAGREAKIRM